MSNNKCPFSTIQAASLCHCSNAKEVIRRGGSEYDCTSDEALPVCIHLNQHMKDCALPELGYEDDLTQTPQSVYERIQIGGLLGLRKLTFPENDDTAINDIWRVVKATTLQHHSISDIPASEFIPSIQAFKRQRRRRR